ncbi:MAG: hypothetical protein M1825_000784 [Sarcosagium campestre]|nr:MAG: hypothetical protein M1825_000784 [Sarcosagium campestre]
MFDIFALALSSLSTFVFPVFASYKALRSSDPAQLTPWLMYWVVLACLLLVESWTEWFLAWLPFYAWIRAFFLLYLVLPQTQGARLLYQTHIDPFLATHESSIDAFISTLHDRAKTAGLQYLRSAVAFVKEHLLGMPAPQTSAASSSGYKSASSAGPTTGAGSYAATLLARFNLPSARPTPNDVYNLFSNALGATTSSSSPSSTTAFNAPDNLIPASATRSPEERMSYIAAQRERLGFMLRALDREASSLSTTSSAAASTAAADLTVAPTSSPLPRTVEPAPDASTTATSKSPSSASLRLQKTKSESEFETVEHDGVGEEKRTPGGGWMPWIFGSGNGRTDEDVVRSTGDEKEEEESAKDK